LKDIFDRRFIENLANSDNTEFAVKMQENVVSVLSLAIENLSSKIPFITLENVIIQPVNEVFNGTVTPMSDYVYFLGINSPQLELNCTTYNPFFKKFKEKLIEAWRDTKKKKKKKKNRDDEGKKYSEFEPEKYNMDSLRHDLQIALAENLSVTSIVYDINDRIIIQGKDDFGSISEIQIIPVIYSGEKFKYFINKRKGFLEINIEERLLNFNIKYESAGDNFYKILKIFNNIFRSISKQSINQVFVESLLYNIPDELYSEKEIYNVFKNIVNYLSMKNISDFVSIENKEEKIINSPLTKNSISIFYKFLRRLN